MNTIGKLCTLTIYGESHGPSIGAVLDGLPAGTVIDWDEVRREMARRAPGQSALTTARKETDAFTVESGWFEGHTTGTPLAVRIANGDQHSRDYSTLRRLMRPGHADYAGRVRYGGWNDHRGGGHFSGRLTAPLVLAGAVARQILRREGIVIGAHILRIADVEDAPFPPLGAGAEALEGLSRQALPLLDPSQEAPMREAILAAKNDADSVGGIIECMAEGLPPGLGDPLFDSVESRLSQMLFSVPAVKGVEFGEGFRFAAMRGSEANDPMRWEDGAVRCTANHNGGLTGGITDGAPLLFRAVIKPTPSIGRAQQTVDMESGEDAVLEVRGRHDPCIVTRAVPVIEAAAAWTLLDILMESRVWKGGPR